MSCKGMSVTAARELVDQTCARFKVPLYILHDFDVAGFTIARTLHVQSPVPVRHVSGETSRSSTSACGSMMLSALVWRPSLDLWQDQQRGDPRSPGVQRGDGSRDRLPADRTRPQRPAGRTERDDLPPVHRLLGREATEHGVGKVIPDSQMLKDAYRLFVRERPRQAGGGKGDGGDGEGRGLRTGRS